MNVIAHGIDMVEVARIEHMLHAHSDRFRRRCFTSGELARGHGSVSEAQHLAARFAAKEAVLKAMGTGLANGIAWTDVEVVTGDFGAPSLTLHGFARRIAHERGLLVWLVSLSHTRTHAIASALAGRD